VKTKEIQRIQRTKSKTQIKVSFITRFFAVYEDVEGSEREKGHIDKQISLSIHLVLYT